MRKSVLTAMGLAALMCVTACAGNRKPPGPGPAERAMRKTPSVVGLLFSRFDADMDYRVTWPELEAGISKAFASADVDQDRSISPLEFEAFSRAALGGNSAPPFRLDFDRDVDGRITQSEFREELLATAEGLDLDKDKVLTQEELTKVTPSAKGAESEGGPEDGEARRGPPGRGGGGMPPRE
ncbi:MAG: EF-hand domain-containing protein [Caulobacterales bacterium]